MVTATERWALPKRRKPLRRPLSDEPTEQEKYDAMLAARKESERTRGVSRFYEPVGTEGVKGPEDQPDWMFLPPEEAELARTVETAKARPPGEAGALAQARDRETARRTSVGYGGFLRPGEAAGAARTLTDWRGAGVQPAAPQMPVAETPEEVGVLRSVEQLDKGGYFKTPEDKIAAANQALNEHRVLNPTPWQPERMEPQVSFQAQPVGTRGNRNVEFATENRRRMNMGYPPLESPETLAAERAGRGAQAAEAETARGRAEMGGRLLASEEESLRAGFDRGVAVASYETGKAERAGRAEEELYQPRVETERAGLERQAAEAKAEIPLAGRKAELGIEERKAKIDNLVADTGVSRAQAKAIVQEQETAGKRAETERLQVEQQTETQRLQLKNEAERTRIEAMQADANVRLANAQTVEQEVRSGYLKSASSEVIGMMITGIRPQTPQESQQMHLELVGTLAAVADSLPEDSPERVEINALAMAALTQRPVRIPRRDLLSRIWNWSFFGRNFFPSEQEIQSPGAGQPAVGGAPGMSNLDVNTATPEQVQALQAELDKRKAALGIR